LDIIAKYFVFTFNRNYNKYINYYYIIKINLYNVLEILNNIIKNEFKNLINVKKVIFLNIIFYI